MFWQYTHQFDVSFGIQHEILRLQVSVQDAFTMEVIKSFCDATHAEFGSVLLKTSPEGEKAEFTFTFFLGGGCQVLRCSGGRRRQGGKDKVGCHKRTWVHMTTSKMCWGHMKRCPSYLSLSRLQISPPRHASSSMYTYLSSLNVRYNLDKRGKWTKFKIDD